MTGTGPACAYVVNISLPWVRCQQYSVQAGRAKVDTAREEALNVDMTLRLFVCAAVVCSLQLSAQSAADGVFQVRYFANLNIADSVINLTNGGALNGADPAGRLCTNVYVFDATSDMVACCACPVAPNALASLSVKDDLLSNLLTPAVPNSIVVKLLSTAPVAGVCNPKSPLTTNLARGMVAWGATVRSTKVGTPPVTLLTATETEFAKVELSATELNKLTTSCAFIQTNGSGFGICKSCRIGGK